MRILENGVERIDSSTEKEHHTPSNIPPGYLRRVEQQDGIPISLAEREQIEHYFSEPCPACPDTNTRSYCNPQELETIVTQVIDDPANDRLLYDYMGLKYPAESGQSYGRLSIGQAWTMLFQKVVTAGQGRFNPNSINLTLWMELERRRNFDPHSYKTPAETTMFDKEETR